MWFFCFFVFILVLILINYAINKDAKEKGIYNIMNSLGTEEIDGEDKAYAFMFIFFATILLMIFPSLFMLVIWFLIIVISAFFSEKLARYSKALEYKRMKKKPTGKNKEEEVKLSFLQKVGIWSIVSSIFKKK